MMANINNKINNSIISNIINYNNNIKDSNIIVNLLGRNNLTSCFNSNMDLNSSRRIFCRADNNRIIITFNINKIRNKKNNR